MQEYQLQVEKITGQANERATGSVFSSRVSFVDGSIGTLVSCVLVSGERGNEVRNIFDAAIKKLEGADNGSLDVLKNATSASGNFVAANNIEASFIHVLFYKNAAYIGRFGEKVKIYIFEPPKSLELVFEHGSGPIKAGQLYLVATEKFLSSFNLNEYFSVSEINVEEAVDGLATEISAKSDSAEIAAALVYVKVNSTTSESEGRVVSEKITSEEILKGQDQFESSVKQENYLDTSHEIAASAPSRVEEPEVASRLGTSQASESSFGPSSDELLAQDKSQKTATIASGFKSSIAKVFGAIFSEISKLRRGDIRALFRLRRNVIAIAVLVLLILGASVFFTLRNNENRQNTSEFNKYLETASSKFEEGLALLELNRQRAREIFIEADESVKKALNLMPDDKKAMDLASKIASKLKDTASQAKVNLQTLTEVDSILVALSKSNGGLVGTSDGVVFQIDVKSKETRKVDGVKGARSGFVFDNNAFVFDGSDISKVDLASGKSEKVIEGEKALDIAVFLGNVYLLSNDQIYKYTPFEGGYAKTIDYLSERRQFSEKSRFVIDGSIWVTNGTEILEYLRGEAQDFAISGLTGNIGKFTEIYTDSDSENIYAIDSENGALLVIGKDGIYKEAYQAAEFANAADLVVDEAAGKFYIAVGSKVLEGGL